jgi:endonuclease/exonuclease/phosphatase family metal-dependent hydrolase
VRTPQFRRWWLRQHLHDNGHMTAPALRVATYNIRALRDDRRAVVRVITALDADLVCVQEAPRFLLWRRNCRLLGADSGLKVIGGGHAAAANLLLARPDVIVHAGRNVLFTKYRGLSARGAALADVTARGVRLTVIGTHLDGQDQPRLAHIVELHQVMDDFITPGARFVVGADVNAEPGSPSWTRLTERATDAAALTSIGDPRTNQPLTPHRRIDALFVGPRLIVRSTHAVDSHDVNLGSDHRPVLAELVAT